MGGEWAQDKESEAISAASFDSRLSGILTPLRFAGISGAVPLSLICTEIAAALVCLPFLQSPLARPVCVLTL